MIFFSIRNKKFKTGYLAFIALSFLFIGCDSSRQSNPFQETPEIQQQFSGWNEDDFQTVYDVGPGKDFEAPSLVPWNDLEPSTLVRIHRRAEPYRTKWFITARGSAEEPIVITGIPSGGQLPVISGENAITGSGHYTNEDRSIIKIGNYTGSDDTDIPAHIFLENLDIRSGRPGYSFTNGNGSPQNYRKNAAAVHIEEGDTITIRGCSLHDSGNGLFTSHFTNDILIAGNYIYDNGIEGSYYEHNTYTESMGIIYEYNYFGKLRNGCGGNNLKDRSAGTIIRYNLIEGGNRQLDLVDTGYYSFFNDPSYDKTFVYGNILVEPDGEGNGQIIHYGGDSSDTDYYRRGTLFLYHNSIISKRTSNTTLIRLSTDDVSADIRNNIIYTTAPPGHLALTNGHGILHLYNNWLTENYRDTFESSSPDILSNENNITGTDPMFTDIDENDFRITGLSPCINRGTTLAAGAASYPATMYYANHVSVMPRPEAGDAADIGAYEKP